jgi:CubicO group peptidase (beta-lactamase class C family)
LIRPITVQDLMRHTAGFVHGDRAQSPRIRKLYDELQIEANKQDILGDQMLKNLGTIPLASQPGTHWEYSIAVDVLGLMLERVENKTLEEILNTLLIKPLGMKDTSWWVEPERLGRLAEAPDSDPLKAKMLIAYRQTTNPVGRTYLRGGAGLLGTAADYMRFLQMMLRGGELDGRRYLSRRTVEFMCSEHTVGMTDSTHANTGPGYGFGLGFAVRLNQGICWVPGSVGESLWSGVWGTSFWLDFKENLTALILTQGPTHKIQSRMLYKTLVYSALVK